ncbi:MAG TPA: hypothetical protein VFL97_05260 [Nitrococcus sp.]|nr:hypothetical protein [Nitrococcus sp.]
MAHAFRAHSATRRRTLLLAMVALLLQQIALGAYACNRLQGTMAGMPVMVPMSDMGQPTPHQADHVLCVKHCTPDRAISSDVRPGMPGAMLAALPPALLTVTAVALTQAPPRHLYPPPSPPPPAILLFCSLLL